MPPRMQPPRSPATNVPLIQTHCRQCLRRAFSSTPAHPTRLRRRMFEWIDGPGKNFRYPLPDSTNYLSAYDKDGQLRRGTVEGDDTEATPPERGVKIARESIQDLRPFPINPTFVSQRVLSEELREAIWKAVKVDGESVMAVSAQYGVEMRRVGAVVRLVELERRMRAENKPLAVPYARAVLSMLPKTPLTNPPRPHEPINDLPVHHATNPQLFYPTSESRAFNRVDAGRVFSAAPRLPDDPDTGQGGQPALEPWKDRTRELVGPPGQEREVLKPADARIPHPHLVAYEKDRLDARVKSVPGERRRRYEERLAVDEKERQEARARARRRQEANTTRVAAGRWEFVFREAKTTREGTGMDGRGTGSPGFRYGVPPQDRKRGQVKIPTRVEA